MATEDEIVEGIMLWLRARQFEAVRTNNKALYLSASLFLEDLIESAKKGEYPWEVLLRAAKDTQARIAASPPILRIVK